MAFANSFCSKSRNALIVIDMETEDTKDAYKKLNDKAEQKDFNKSYADMMVDGHKKAVDLFEKQSTESSDVEIREWATSMLPELRTHLDQAIAVQALNQMGEWKRPEFPGATSARRPGGGW